MFSEHDNAMLTGVGPGTPMGRLLRRFWLPFLLPEELPAPDCPPIRVRLLGEDLVAFRDTNGRLGLLDRFCPHRRVDLYFGRNEQCGLRCVYHGWKFDVHGNVLDMPAEPPNTALKQEVKIKSYPVMEWGGVIWAYMGDEADKPSRPPEMEWGLVPPAHRFITKRLQETNYAQGVEGGIDSSHVGILHSLLDPNKIDAPFRERQISVSAKVPYLAKDTSPRFFIRPTDYGMLIGARRHANEEQYYWRITQFLTPFYTMIARTVPDGPIMGHAWTPIDDHNVWVFTMTWNPDRPLGDEEKDDGVVHAPVMNDGSYRPIQNRQNNYGLDREVQRRFSTTGIAGIGIQDAAVQESMGPIVDRSREMLGSGDAAIAAFRKLLLKLCAEHERGTPPAAAAHPEWYRVRSAGVVLDKGVDFQQGAAERLKVA
jgi:phenylpropionate dioxygenase-like ring-hydroxylating dioxygenase large terminal subunit